MSSEVETSLIINSERFLDFARNDTPEKLEGERRRLSPGSDGELAPIASVLPKVRMSHWGFRSVHVSASRLSSSPLKSGERIEVRITGVKRPELRNPQQPKEEVNAVR